MLLGYNAYIEFLKGVSENQVRGLFNDPLIYSMLVKELKEVPTDKKVLRFPGGTGSRTLKYDKKTVDKWIKFCKDAEVTKNTFVFAVNNPSDSYKYLKDISNAGIEIVLIEYGNEEYDHQVNNVFEGFLERVFKAGFYKDKGKKYGQKYKQVRVQLKNLYPGVPVACVLKNPTNTKAINWWNGIKSVTTIKDVVLHEYKEPRDNNFYPSMRRGLPKFSGYNLYFTEANLVWHYPKWKDVPYTPEHKKELEDYFNFLKIQPNVKMVLYHSIWGHSNFAAYVVEGIELVNKYENWKIWQ